MGGHRIVAWLQWDGDAACRGLVLFVSEFPGNCQGSWLLCGAEKGIPLCVCVCVCEVGEKPAGWSRSQGPSGSEKDIYIREVISSQNVNSHLQNIKTIQNEIFLLKYLPHSPCFYSLPQQVATVTSIFLSFQRWIFMHSQSNNYYFFSFQKMIAHMSIILHHACFHLIIYFEAFPTSIHRVLFHIYSFTYMFHYSFSFL